MNKSILLLFGLLLAVTVNAAISVKSVSTEGLPNPLGLDMQQPRLSWIIAAGGLQNVQQQAYEVMVASSAEKLERNEADMWSSGKVKSRQSVWVIYQGKPLQSNGAYFWKVRVWTNRGASSWSAPGRWTMGLLYEREWRARWIGLDRAMPWDSETQWSRLSARYLRKEFPLKNDIKRAAVHISGLGVYELFLNGQRVGDQVLAPAPTDYRKSVLYNTYEVTELLRKGNNAVGVTLGNGRYYTMRQDYKPYKINTFGYPKLRMALIVEYADGSTETISSNESWKLTADGPIRTNNEYDGEEYDARKELGAWTYARLRRCQMDAGRTGGYSLCRSSSANYARNEGAENSKACQHQQIGRQIHPRFRTKSHRMVAHQGKRQCRRFGGDAFCRNTETGWQFAHGQPA
jgi:alpha-L-rhamnosidase